MASKSRAEGESGLYDIITRGNNRQGIFNSEDDYLKLLAFPVSRRQSPCRFYES